MLHAGVGRTGLADCGLLRNRSDRRPRLCKRTRRWRIPSLYDYTALAVVEKTDKTGIAAACSTDCRENRSTTKKIPKTSPFEQHNPLLRGGRTVCNLSKNLQEWRGMPTVKNISMFLRVLGATDENAQSDCFG
jgi:hypothetical protein